MLANSLCGQRVHLSAPGPLSPRSYKTLTHWIIQNALSDQDRIFIITDNVIIIARLRELALPIRLPTLIRRLTFVLTGEGQNGDAIFAGADQKMQVIWHQTVV